MKTLFLALVLSAAAAAAACNDDMLDVDVDQFSPLADLDDLPYAQLNPARTWQYWELRYGFGPGSDDRILASGGTRQRSELSPATIAALESAAPTSGFFNGCLPAHCFASILTVDETGAVGVVRTRETLVGFLGLIDSVVEAALVVRSHNLYWSDLAVDTGFREVGVGWEFLAFDLVRDCAPVQTDRVHVLVRADGSLRELGREIHSKLEGACV